MKRIDKKKECAHACVIRTKGIGKVADNDRENKNELGSIEHAKTFRIEHGIGAFSKYRCFLQAMGPEVKRTAPQAPLSNQASFSIRAW